MKNNIIKNKKAAGYVLVGLAFVVAIIIAISTTISGNGDERDSSKYAKELYEHKVEDINDTALVADLFEVLGFEDLAGEYTVEISQEGDTLVLALNILEGIQNIDKKTFDSNMKDCAQQMLALIPQVGRIQWTYQVATDGDKEEVSVGAFSRVDFESMLGKAPEYFGETEENIKKLLEQQKKS